MMAPELDPATWQQAYDFARRVFAHLAGLPTESVTLTVWIREAKSSEALGRLQCLPGRFVPNDDDSSSVIRTYTKEILGTYPHTISYVMWEFDHGRCCVGDDPSGLRDAAG